MMRNAHPNQAVLTVAFALPVRAASKTRAFELAMCQLSERNLCLDRIRLANAQGNELWCSVERIESVRWTAAESTEFSHLFQVHGQIRLEIALEQDALIRTPLPLPGEYRLPCSSVSEMTVWVIPTAGEPVFAQVLAQSLERRLPCSAFSLTSAV